ncbi:MAG: acetyl-CoA carboxylase carboxyltransferase subunit beta [Deltaproteobacteria bacterium]|nr:acetyl-CoA carboxylase carboxyltransferase subunit beta [Deltaproteobacteria bacterium]
MSWFAKTKAGGDADEKRSLGEGVFKRCDGCGATLLAEELTANLEVCPSCGFHHRLTGEQWRDLVTDPESWVEEDADLVGGDPLQFVDGKAYPDRLKSVRRTTGVQEGMAIGTATVGGHPVQAGFFYFRFMGGSMGSIVGEKVTRLFERGRERRTPVVLLQASGGARMQEGIFSLMQMAKAVAALSRLREAGQPFVSLLANPTTGGVAASFALLGDVNLAEPRALIGFAGPRVIEQTIRQKLPDGFQRSEFLLEHGMVDLIVERRDMRDVVAKLLGHLADR